MTKKDKPKNKSKPQKGAKRGRKKSTAHSKINQEIKKLKEDAKKAYSSATKANKQAKSYVKKASKKGLSNLAKKKYLRLSKQYKNKYHAELKKYHNYKKKIDSKKGKKKRVVKAKITDQAAMASQIEEHAKKWTNEGNMAIFPTQNGKSSDIVYFSPYNSESESNSSNITSYAVDQGAPRKDYARFSSKTISIDGVISDSDTGTAHDKWVKLRTWHSHHEELTFRGDIYYKHLLISALNRQFTGPGLINQMQVSITFTFVRAAEITTSNKNKKHAKSSKSSKTVAGNRSKKYKAVTIKNGDTLWGFSKKYGKPVSWLQKVNKIKNPNKIYAGNLIYVNDKKHKASSKLRVS